jgi:hypothetical protein
MRRTAVFSAATSSATVMSATPLAPWTFGPPRSSGVTSSPSTLLMTPGPVRPKNVFAAWMMKLPWRGRYAPPPALYPNMHMMLGATPLILRSAVNASA